MKNKIFLAVLALALGASPALAATSTATTSTGYRLGKPFQDIREEYKEKREEVKNKIQEDRAEAKDKIKAIATSSEDRKDKVEAIRLERIRAFAAQMQERLMAALARSQKFVDRITAFINEREASGADVTKVRAKVNEASAVIASSTAKVNSIPTQIEVALNASSTPKDIFLNVKKIIGEGVTAIKAAHQKVVEAVKTLKTIPNKEKEDDNATSTSTN